MSEQVSSGWIGGGSWRVLRRGAGTDVDARCFVHTLAAKAQRSSAAAVAGAVELGKITPEMIDAAAAIAGISVTAEQKTIIA
jgi:hypothetical protein